MKAEMPTKYWSSMPETQLINERIREAPQRLQQMAKNTNTNAHVDMNLSLDELRIKSQSCQACPLFKKAHNTVFGVGPKNARIMIIGEQPGDQEDLKGLPFIGPAGEVLEKSLKENGLLRENIYLTHAVKHFKWVPHTANGETMHLHQKPSGAEAHACRPWLEAETAQIKPKIIIALGATAGTTVLGRLPKVSDERGKIFSMTAQTKIVLS
ncbi:MAG: UdgX family uracil-DNA binding protein [Pseudobdellovibrio sp.]